MLYELRLYNVVAGRMEDNHDRHRAPLITIFARHGINVVGRWTAVAGPNAPLFAYMMAYHDLAAREAQWAGFYGDENWWRLRTESNAGSEMVERFELNLLRSNQSWQPPAHGVEARQGGIHELLCADVALGKGAEANRFVASTLIPAVVRQGGAIMMVADFLTGIRLPRLAIMIAWAHADAHYRGRRGVDGDPEVRSAQQAERETLGRTTLGRTDVYLLEPTAFNLPLATLGLQ
jgi:hypothetical protein